jgi:excinuclease ABC subunit B
VKMTAKELDKEIKRLERNMKEYARLLEYELAAVMRDQIIKLRGEMQKARDKKK